LQGRGRRAELAPVFDDLNRYAATTHFNGQSTVTISGAAASGESYCLAHHVSVEGGEGTWSPRSDIKTPSQSRTELGCSLSVDCTSTGPTLARSRPSD